MLFRTDVEDDKEGDDNDEDKDDKRDEEDIGLFEEKPDEVLRCAAGVARGVCLT